MRSDDFEDAGVNLLDGGFVADGKDAARLADSDLFVLLIDAAVKVVGLALETVFVRALVLGVPLVAAAGAMERSFERG
jgi:hypothetical protein